MPTSIVKGRLAGNRPQRGRHRWRWINDFNDYTG